MSGKDIRVYEDWNEIDAFGNEVSVHNPVSYANTPDGFSDDPKTLYHSSEAEDLADEIGVLDAMQESPSGIDFLMSGLIQATSVVRDLNSNEQYGLAASFEMLPLDAQEQILMELAMGDGDSRRLATPFEEQWLGSVLSHDAEMALRSHWRGRYERTVAKIARRVRRILKNMPARDRRSVDEWFDELTDRQAIAACIALAT